MAMQISNLNSSIDLLRCSTGFQISCGDTVPISAQNNELKIYRLLTN